MDSRTDGGAALLFGKGPGAVETTEEGELDRKQCANF